MDSPGLREIAFLALLVTVPTVFPGACAAHLPETPVRREIAMVRCTVTERRIGDETRIVIGGRLGFATFNFRIMSYRLDRQRGRIVSTAVSRDGRRTAELSGRAVVTFPRRGETGEIVFNESDRVDRIACGH